MPENSTQTEESRMGFDDAREHFKAARACMRKSIQDFFPPGFTEHRRAAHKEILLSLRSLLDAAIQRTEAGTKN